MPNVSGVLCELFDGLMLSFRMVYFRTYSNMTPAAFRGAVPLQAFGPISSCRILTDPKTGISRCAGLLRFETPDKAMRAIRDMHGRQVILQADCAGMSPHLGLLSSGVCICILMQLWDPWAGDSQPYLHQQSGT